MGKRESNVGGKVGVMLGQCWGNVGSNDGKTGGTVVGN